MPNIRLKNLEGDSVSFIDIAQDDILVVSLWATWCIPCIKELDAISYVYENWQSEAGVRLIAVSVDDSRTIKKVRPFVYGKAWNYEFLLDSNNDLKRALGANIIPLTLIVKNNKILYRQSGYSSGKEQVLFDKIMQLKDE